MTLRLTVLAGALALAFSACPPSESTTDAGTDGSQNQQTGDCTAPCGPLQKCHAERHVCVDLCNDDCGPGTICVSDDGANPRCEVVTTTCGGNECAHGQNSCAFDTCTCTPSQFIGDDSCALVGGNCRQPYNPVTQQGGVCDAPRLYEYCDLNCPSGQVGGSCKACPTGQVCITGVLLDTGHCARPCNTQAEQCGVDEVCAGTDDGNVCLMNGVFRGRGCVDDGPTLPDGGPSWIPTDLAAPCFQRGDDGAKAETTPSGTCTWVYLYNQRQPIPVDYCRSPGPIPENGACKTDQMQLDGANMCATGLECVPTGRGNDGLCRPICVTRIGSSEPDRGCGADEACVNIDRFLGTDEIRGACMQTCNVFDPAPNNGCAAYGATATACVPVPPSGTVRASSDGSGICVPLLPGAKAEGEACADVDAFKGATCQAGLVCALVGDGTTTPRCVKPCDRDCVPGDGGIPARCGTEANATCAGSRTCQMASSRFGADMGYCL